VLSVSLGSVGIGALETVGIGVFARVLGAVWKDDVVDPAAEAGLGGVRPEPPSAGLDGGCERAAAGGAIVLVGLAVLSGVSYRLEVADSLGAVATLGTASRRAVGVEIAACLAVPVPVTSVAVSYFPAVVVNPLAVSYRSEVLSDLRDGILGIEDRDGAGRSGRGRLGEEVEETDDPD